jgi:hypothetical protein
MYLWSIIFEGDILWLYDRQRELVLLDNLYARQGRQMFVLYGRRRDPSEPWTDYDTPLGRATLRRARGRVVHRRGQCLAE